MTQAIFLSYASQDADAARRICDALRATGLEVWFDQSELRGGDAWDASIRKQIKECALFVPIISASTDARAEGYFRLEWKLAVDRSHLMADDQAFFVPVILGETVDATARVPDVFRARQWTRVTDDASVRQFAERIAKLVSGASLEGNAQSAGEKLSPAIAQSTDVAKPVQPKRRRVLQLTYLGAGLVAAGGFTGLAIWQPWKKTTDAAKAGTATLDPTLKRAIDIIESTNTIMSDVTLAEDLVKGVLDQRPTDVDATIAMARIHTYLLLRGWDRSEERFANGKRFSERALALAPNNPDALGAMVTYLYMRRVDLPLAAKLARDALALAPDNPYHYRMLTNVLSSTSGISDDEKFAAAKQLADRFPKDALAQYEAGRLSRDLDRTEDAGRYFDLAIRHGPVATAIMAQARLRLWIHNDIAGMKALLDSLPERQRATDRAVMSQVLYGIATRDFGRSMAALASFPDPWMSDYDYTGPTALIVGEVLLLQGKAALAKIRFGEAQAELARRKPVITRNFNTVWLDSWLLMRLGKLDEARQRNNIVHQELLRPYRINSASSWMFSPIPRNLLLGERGKALELLGEAAKSPSSRTFIANAMQIDPRMAPFRNDKEIMALLSEPKKAP